jgi:hypothetical protein
VTQEVAAPNRQPTRRPDVFPTQIQTSDAGGWENNSGPAKTVTTPMGRVISPGGCTLCGFDDQWSTDGRGAIICSCQTCPECGMFDGHEIGCKSGQEENDDEG